MMAAGSHGFGSVLPCRVAFNVPPVASEAIPMFSRGTYGLSEAEISMSSVTGLTLDRLTCFGVSEALVTELERLVEDGADENAICLLCLHAMLKARRKLPGLDRDGARKVRQEAKLLAAEASLVRAVEALVKQWA